MPTEDYRQRATEQLEELDVLLTPPKFNAKRNRAVHDGWRIILKPKKGRMRRRLRDLAEARRWVYGDDDAAVCLAPAQWNHVIRQIASYYVKELDGARQQYESIRLVWRQNTWFGTKTAPGQIVKGKKVDADVPAAEAERAKKTMAEVFADWDSRKKALSKLEKDFRSLLKDMQKAEEGRLETRRRGLKQQDPGFDDAKAKAALAAMKIKRIDGDMRKWLAPHRSALKALGEV